MTPLLNQKQTNNPNVHQHAEPTAVRQGGEGDADLDQGPDRGLCGLFQAYKTTIRNRQKEELEFGNWKLILKEPREEQRDPKTKMKRQKKNWGHSNGTLNELRHQETVT